MALKYSDDQMLNVRLKKIGTLYRNTRQLR